MNTTGSFANTVVKNANTDGTWSTATGYPLNLQTNASGAAVTYLVTLSGGRVYAVVSFGTYNPVKGYLFNSTWGAAESIYSSNTWAYFLSVVTDGTNVYTFTPAYYSPYLYCDTRVNAGTHTYTSLPNVAATATNTPVTSSCTGTGALTVYYENYSGKNVYYQQLVGTWQNPLVLSAESTDGLATNNQYFSAAPGANTLVYFTKTGSPYNIKSASVPATTNTPTSKAFGTVQPGTTYYANGSGYSNPVTGAQCSFTVQNTGSSTCGISLTCTNATGGNTWTLVSSAPSGDQFEVIAVYSGENPASGLVLTTSPQTFDASLAAGATLQWDFEEILGGAGTGNSGTFSDSAAKTYSLSLTAY